MEKTAPGKGMLKVVGILGIVFGGINSVLILYGFLTIDVMLNMNQMPAPFGFQQIPEPTGLQAFLGDGTVRSHWAFDFPWEIYYLFVFAIVCYGIFISIMAIAHCSSLEKARLLRFLGKFGVVLIVVAGFIDFFAFGVSAIFMLPINLVLPILYIIGASKNVNELWRIKSSVNKQ